MKLDKISIDGKKDSIEVLDKIFSAKINHKLVSAVLYKTNANYKGRHAKTKQQNEVKGPTSKIYAQKGTGGARHASRKAPIFVGGGIAHGPKGELAYKKRKLNNDNTPTSSSSKTCSSGASTIAKEIEGAKKNGISKTLWRYYHLFEEKELENLIHKTKSLKIIEAGKQYHNWYVIVQKQYVTNDSTVKCCIE